jgi:hypothetical protein
MHRRLFASILVVLALTAAHQVTVAARPLYVVCAMTDGTDLLIVVENFGGVGGAVQQCVHFWKGLARGVVR